MDPQISVVVLTLNEGEMLARTVRSLRATLPKSAEIIVVDDGSTDGSTAFLADDSSVRTLRTDHYGVARGRNHGMRHARGEYIIVSDAHIEVPKGWWRPMIKVLKKPKTGMAGPGIVDMNDPERRGFGMRLLNAALEAEWISPEWADPLPVALLPGGFWGMRRDVFQATGGLDDGMLRWGAEDFELSLRLWMLGYEQVAVPEVEVAHLFRHESPYPMSMRWPRHNQLRMAWLHFTPDRFERVRSALEEYEEYEEGFALFEASRPALEARRQQLHAMRTRNDDEYFAHWGEI